jgi:subtilisin family serine protease
MSTSEYIIVRRHRLAGDQEPFPGMESLRGDDRGASEETAEDTAADHITTGRLDDYEVKEVTKDPERILSPSVPVSLIAPVATQADADEDAVNTAKAQGTAWGVATVAPNAGPNAGANVVVAVLDTGIDPKHPAFSSVNIDLQNFTSSPYDDDRHGHGTHCAGTIFGQDVDGVRIGVARGVRKALIGKVLDDKGRGDSVRIAQAVQWAQRGGAQVISMSLGIDFRNVESWYKQQGMEDAEAFSRALTAFRDTVRVFDEIVRLFNAQSVLMDRGVIFVAATGNDSRRDAAKPYVVDLSLPAAAIGIISTGAIARGPQGFVTAPFSNINPQVCAPGVGIVSAKHGGGLCGMSGTSMATPHVAGLAALWWEDGLRENPRTTSEQVRSRIIAHCRTAGFASGVVGPDHGAGLAQAPMR